ncbi:MAG: proton-conducting transporter membrane subunit [Desulfuromonadaceae bacterium]|nr:proton-conducting transporter membrane subunit [Desulfuromonadaceae bacterium]MDD2848688.1 proton-conducting transporter membrane subunit [Desulfuromonadaceae bacterium]MDD4130809.1 proton-conducting transporter membrane subunit [Desulfuromonadaceae bacterium]
MAQELVAASTLIFAATLLAALSGAPLLVPGLLSVSRGQLLATVLMLAASALGLIGAAVALISGSSEIFQLAWALPFGPAEIGIDPLSAWFLIPIFLITGCAALYARTYWHAGHYPHNVRKMTFFFGVMTAGMSAVVLARDGISFLFAWEIMALASYFLITTEDEKPEVNAAGTLYMITTHTGTLGLFALFPLLNLLSGSWLFPAAGSLTASSPLAAAVYLIALFGFGMKAGIMPLHIWLPSAHANAPSHVSAVMSGVILKVGVYGIVRTLSFFNAVPLWWGCSVLALGGVSGVVGVAFAIGQHDLKRLLAYHSIENIGIIFMGLGVALVGQATGSPAMMLLGMSGALLHVLNHALFKALLFLGAGSVIHATGTREMDLMGGAARRLPYTALLFGVGAVAICGLPPLNGFVSELLIYLGFFQGIQGTGGAAAAAAALAAPALALVGGLAVACFVKVYGIVFLGSPRAERHEASHEAGWPMLLPMLLLGSICLVIGLAPSLVAGPLGRVSLTVLPLLVTTAGLPLQELAPLEMITIAGALLLALISLVTFWYRRRLAGTVCSENVTWGCGYQRPAPRIQYSASSFAGMLTSLFAFVLKPQSHPPEIAAGIFPDRSRFSSHVPEAVLELVYIPALKRLYARFSGVRKLQNGILQQYVLYSLVTLVVLLAVSYF